MKTIFNNDVNEGLINKSVVLYGWVAIIRKLGKITFINLRDSSGIIQLIINDKSIISNITKESVIEVKGIVKKRINENKKLATGKIEILVHDIKILSKSNELPFDIENSHEVKEDLRIKYRYLDLRNFRMLNNMKMRHNVFLFIRNFFNMNKFIEIETPMLTKSTPEGANDFLIPTRFSPPSFFALPQSPQMYKQLLMVSGIERYYQITKVFRDEDLRADRQLEFTQLDIELSFTSINQIQGIVENMLNGLFISLKLASSLKFKHMNYNDALNIYGTDKPDTRFGIKLIDAKKYFHKSSIEILSKANSIKFIYINNVLNDKEISLIKEIAKKHNNLNIFCITIQNSNIDSPIFKNNNKEITNLINDYKLDNCSLFIAANDEDIVNLSLGAIRVELGRIFDLPKKGIYNFLWINEWPLFEYNKNEKKYISMHHPFTAPTKEYENNLHDNVNIAKSKAYDLVLNGHEIAGGSIRINDINIQKEIFKILKLSDKDIDNKFGFLLESFKYGIPPHGGIAFGLDRLLMIIQNEKSIREVIAFPKNSKAYDPLINAPSSLNEDLLLEYKIKFK